MDSAREIPFLRIFLFPAWRNSHLITSCVHRRTWKPVKVSWSGPPISHLFFADALILFVEASINQILILKDCLHWSSLASGQKVNFEKSNIFCSPNTPAHLAKDIARISGSQLVTDLGKYLGVPLIHSRIHADTYSHITDKVRTHLSTWKSHTLSMAGKLVYVKTVLAALPNYLMQTVLSVSICKGLDKLVCDFLWGHTQNDHAVNLVGRLFANLLPVVDCASAQLMKLI